MIKILKLATPLIMAGMVAVLFASTAPAPAPAWWEATGKQLKGQVKVISGFISIGRVECNGQFIEASWDIQAKGQIKQHPKEGAGAQTKSGPHLYIKVNKWGNACLYYMPPGLGFRFHADIEPCELQLAQIKGSLTATLGVATICIVRVPETGLTWQIPAGMETKPESNTGINVGLSQLKLKNVGNNQIAEGEISGLQVQEHSTFETVILGAFIFASPLELELEGVRAV